MLKEMRGEGRIRRRRMFYCNYSSYFGAEDCVEVESEPGVVDFRMLGFFSLVCH